MSENQQALEFAETIRVLRDVLNDIRRQQTENSESLKRTDQRLSHIETALQLQEQHNRGLDRAFGEIEKLRVELEAASANRHTIEKNYEILTAKISTGLKAIAIAFTLFSGVGISAMSWMTNEIFIMRDMAKEHAARIAVITEKDKELKDSMTAEIAELRRIVESTGRKTK